MGFNCLKATATLRRQFTFYHSVPRNSWYSFYQPRKDERLSWPWSHPVVLNMGLLDWESSALTTRLLLHCSKFPPKLFVGQCGLTHIDHLRILYKFPPKQFVGQCSLTHIVHSRILCKFPPKLVFKYLSKNCIWDITVWSILSFHRSFSYTNFQQKLLFFFVIFFLMFKNLFKKFYQGQYGLTHIVFSRILYKCSPNASIFFAIKNLLKNCIRHSKVWLLFSFSRILSSFH